MLMKSNLIRRKIGSLGNWNNYNNKYPSIWQLGLNFDGAIERGNY